VPAPGFAEIDRVAPSGEFGGGRIGACAEPDRHSHGRDRVACAAGVEPSGGQEARDEIAGVLPFRLPGLDSDNGSEFIHWHLQGWGEAKKIQLRRGRPYKQDDNAPGEQKNWTPGRKLLGWEGYDSQVAVAAINDLYRHELRWWLNLYWPSVKLVNKVRVGSKGRRI